MALRPRDCPCGSGARYAVCCGPLHEGKTQASSPEALMRSRFAAFAVGAGAYLVATLASDHPDRSVPEAALARELGRAREKQRFLGLSILFTRAEAEEGEVLFLARIFEKGSDRSFAELSRFVREGAAWRYASGETLEKARLPEDLAELDRERFLALVRGS